MSKIRKAAEGKGDIIGKWLGLVVYAATICVAAYVISSFLSWGFNPINWTTMRFVFVGAILYCIWTDRKERS